MQRQSHVRALIDADGRSVKQIERDADLREGTIGYYLKPSTPEMTRLPRLDVMERFAAALDVDLEIVSSAFIRDAGIPSGANEFSPEEVQFILRLRALPEDDRQRMFGFLAVFEQHRCDLTATRLAVDR